MAADEVVRIVLQGRGFGDDFVGFVEERARRFQLSGSVRWTEAGQIDLVAAGAPALIDMLEVACMLGPDGALVDRIDRSGVEGPRPMGAFRRG